MSGTFLNNIKQPDLFPNSFVQSKKGRFHKNNKSQYGRYRVAKQPSTETTRSPPRHQKVATHPSSQSLCLSEPAVTNARRVLLRQSKGPFSKKQSKSSHLLRSWNYPPKKKTKRIYNKNSPLDIHGRIYKKNHHLTYTCLRSQNHHLIFEKKRYNKTRLNIKLHVYIASDPSIHLTETNLRKTLMVLRTAFFIGHILRQTTSISQPKVLTVHESNLFGIGWLPPWFFPYKWWIPGWGYLTKTHREGPIAINSYAGWTLSTWLIANPNTFLCCSIPWSSTGSHLFLKLTYPGHFLLSVCPWN